MPVSQEISSAHMDQSPNVVEMIEEIRMPKPKRSHMNNTKVINFISSTSRKLFETSLHVNTLIRKNVSVTVDLMADSNLHLSNPNITQYDHAVMDSAYTLMVNGAVIFTREMIVRALCGDPDADVTPQKVGAVTKSINKLSLIRITIDCTDEFIARKIIEPGQKAILTSYLMPVKEIMIRSANHQAILRGYQFLEKPVLYSYAEQVHQIISFETRLLRKTGKISNTDEVIVIKRYLIRRIEMLKNEKNKVCSSKISYHWYDAKKNEEKGMFHALGYDPQSYSQWKVKRNRIHGIVIAILGDFLKENYIVGYEINREGRNKVVGVTVIVKK